jgi:hypothetical protein
MEWKMMKLLIIAWITWMAFSGLCNIVRRVRAVRTFNAKRETICFRYEPFLWMRRVV